MEWSRLSDAAFDAFVLSFALGAILSPPDPVTQLLFAAPAFLVALPLAYRYADRIHGRGWSRHLVFVGALFASQFVWRLLVRAGTVDWAFYSPVRVGVLLAGLALGAWLAYFGGVERVRASDGATTVAVSVPLAYALAAVLAPDPTRLLGYAAGLLAVTVPVTYHFVAARGE